MAALCKLIGWKDGWFRRRALRFTRPDTYTMMRSQPGWVEEAAGVMIGHW